MLIPKQVYLLKVAQLLIKKNPKQKQTTFKKYVKTTVCLLSGQPSKTWEPQELNIGTQIILQLSRGFSNRTLMLLYNTFSWFRNTQLYFPSSFTSTSKLHNFTVVFHILQAFHPFPYGADRIHKAKQISINAEQAKFTERFGFSTSRVKIKQMMMMEVE